MWYCATIVVGLVGAWIAWKWWQVGKSWRIATAGLQLGVSQKLALRMLRMAWRTMSKLPDEKCLPIHRALAIYVKVTEEEEWTARIKNHGWLEPALSEFMDSIERSLNPTDPLMLELERMGILEELK